MTLMLNIKIFYFDETKVNIWIYLSPSNPQPQGSPLQSVATNKIISRPRSQVHVCSEEQTPKEML